MHITIPIKHRHSNTIMTFLKFFIVVLTVKLYHAMAGFDVLRNILVGHGFALVSHKAGKKKESVRQRRAIPSDS